MWAPPSAAAAALGADAVLISPRCADPLYRRSVRVSMGTVFQVPWTRLPEWSQARTALSDLGFHIAALALSDGAVGLEEFAADRPERVALLLGAEGDGLSRRAMQVADTVVTIPMAGGVDSLNVAAAAAVALWALRQHRRSGAAGAAPVASGAEGCGLGLFAGRSRRVSCGRERRDRHRGGSLRGDVVAR